MEIAIKMEIDIMPFYAKVVVDIIPIFLGEWICLKIMWSALLPEALYMVDTMGCIRGMPDCEEIGNNRAYYRDKCSVATAIQQFVSQYPVSWSTAE